MSITLDKLAFLYLLLTHCFYYGVMKFVPLAHPNNSQLNPLSPQDALKHHFTSLKTDLIFLLPRVLE